MRRAVTRLATTTVALAFVVTATSAVAHPAPSSAVTLDFGSSSVHAELMLPESELAYAMPDAPAIGGDGRLDEAALARYVVQHVAAETAAGAKWAITVGAVREEAVDGHAYVSVAIDMTPPGNGQRGDFVLVDDAITHEVRNHVVVVSVRDTAAAGAASQLVGILQYPASRVAVTRPGIATRRQRLPWVAAIAAIVALAAGWTWKRRAKLRDAQRRSTDSRAILSGWIR